MVYQMTGSVQGTSICRMYTASIALLGTRHLNCYTQGLCYVHESRSMPALSTSPWLGRRGRKECRRCPTRDLKCIYRTCALVSDHATSEAAILWETWPAQVGELHQALLGPSKCSPERLAMAEISSQLCPWETVQLKARRTSRGLSLIHI